MIVVLMYVLAVIIAGIVGVWENTSENTYSSRRKKFPNWRGSLEAMGFVGLIGGIILVVVCGATSCGTAMERNSLEVFYEENAQLYEDAKMEIHGGVVSSSDGLLALENVKQIDPFAEAVEKQRSKYVEHNHSLKKHTYWQDHPLCNWFYMDVSSDVGYLSLGEE